ncbi:MAG: hypothetical protein COC23_07685 [Hyphomicrobiales bacterium]|nr:MAG: hypothetical protein COC23_07685 [Hyphomicrobiales bacterium]
MKNLGKILTFVTFSCYLAAPALADGKMSPKLESFSKRFAEDCTLLDTVPAQVFKVRQTIEYDDKETEFEIVQLFCNRAAYNTSEIWLIKGTYDQIKAINFAVPVYHVNYADKEETSVESIELEGMGSELEMSNSHFDPNTMTFTSSHKWRGIGDASSGGVWKFSKGRVVLQNYQVDASWDGKINPQTIVDYTK